MAEKEDCLKVSRGTRIGRAILDLPKQITEPSKSFEDEGDRRKARFLSVALFVATAVYPILQITSEVTNGIPYYSLSAIYLAFLYLMSRTKHLRIASALAIIFSATFPFIILIFNSTWGSHNLAFQILTWPVLAVLLGSQLLQKEKEAALIILMNIGLAILCWIHPGIAFPDAIEFIAVSFALQALLWFTTWTNEYYAMKIEENNRSIENRRRELEIYTSLLRHDLSNDIQMVQGGLELAQITADEPKKQASFIESTIAAAERMRSLIHIFSVSEDELENDIVTVLEMICKRAGIAFKRMKIALEVEKEARNRPLYYSKLTALAFENLLRNTAQHAGNSPNVGIKITLTGNHLVIIFEDDGPGIAEEIREHLFGRGVTTESKGRGLGLYLTKNIIESEGGSIELVDTGRPGCCFQIKLPLN
ncbi:HAMP domain-containing histidine kinase [Candidatus Thorarchaeota archaeon]|nr:MAG: HAMP domain-containing histidine kinase [Candidatus Thorarchaeota archaeon]